MENWFKGHKKWYKLHPEEKTDDKFYESPKFRVNPIFKWFDFWIGFYIDQENRIIYFFPVPMVGWKIGYQYKDE